MLEPLNHSLAEMKPVRFKAAGGEELCSNCSKIDFFSLFTGPRRYAGRPESETPVVATLGTLAEVQANASCPLCRLIKYGFGENCARESWALHGEELPDPTQVRFKATAYRADYMQGTSYIEKSTRDMLASMLQVSLQELVGSRRLSTGQHWIQLYSPYSFDPVRPLLNGHLVTDLKRSLELVCCWLNSCIECHGQVCDPHRISGSTFCYDLKCIDVKDRKIIRHNVARDEYAVLSYVWGKDQDRYIQLREHLASTMSTSLRFSSMIPQTIEDAITVCQALQIPYLWVDLYCIEQHDLARKASEIQAMDQIFRNAKIALIAGRGEGSDSGLLSFSGKRLAQQRAEVVQGRRYVTAAQTLIDQIQQSSWSRRAWTMQEGQLARRCAFFGPVDISFLCGSGHWREALHSGNHGHDSVLPGIDISSDAWDLLSASRWLRDRKWSFSDYDSLLSLYTFRDITYESDRLNAITGCLNIMTEATEVGFIAGLPLRDFHYALLWSGEYDHPRLGFPSWSWVGWHCLEQSHNIFPASGASCHVIGVGNDLLVTEQPTLCEAEMSGLLISLTEREHTNNRCAQEFADISLSRSKGTITIDSFSAHFAIDISPAPVPNIGGDSKDPGEVPPEFDSQSGMTLDWNLEEQYSTPYARMKLRDQHGNSYQSYYPYWYHHWPPFRLDFPQMLQGSSLQWLLAQGIELIRIVEVELLEAPDQLKPFHHVLCLGVDRRVSDIRRFGSFCIPKEIWEKADPKPVVVTIS